MLRAAIDGIKARGNAELGDKTLLDALVPMTDAVEAAELADGADPRSALAAAAAVARAPADATRR